jgi:ATP phosphoribosyltransferase
VIREEIMVSTARLIANPVAHKLKSAAIDTLVARMREQRPASPVTA